MRAITRTVVFAGCSTLFVFCAIVGGLLLVRATLPNDSGVDADPAVALEDEDSEGSTRAPRDDAAGGQDEVLEGVGAAYEETKGELRSAYDESKDALPPEVAGPLEQDLNLIESAIAEIDAALASDPDNESLKRMLVATWRNEMMPLKRALISRGTSRRAVTSSADHSNTIGAKRPGWWKSRRSPIPAQ